MKQRIDDLGLRALVFVLAQGWFVLLWGLGVPAIAAGLALGLLGQLALSRYRREHAINREAALRRRIGGELMLEEMTLSPQRKADHVAAQLLAGAYAGVSIGEETPEGVRCRCGEEALLVRCVARPAEAELTQADVAAAARACRVMEANRAVLCVLCKTSASAADYAERLPSPVRIVPRERMIRLAGAAFPVTDAQLLELAAREKKLTPADVARGALRRVKARRYMTYGVALMLLYVVTGLKYYPIPGMLCMLLAVGSRCMREEPEAL